MTLKDDYLWDRSGRPEPGMEKLEQQLGKFRHAGRAPSFSQEEFEKLRRRRPWFRRFFTPWPRLVLTSASVAVLVAGIYFFGFFHRPATEAAWAVTRLYGAPRVGTETVVKTARISVGQSLVTDARSRARIRIGDIGEVEIEPNSRVRLLETGARKKGLALDRGVLHARISAPPWQFYVDTPSATAVDLGCEYTLTVDDSGAGFLRVTLGWVQFYAGERQALIPAGGVVKTRPGTGPGTPYFEDVSPQFQRAVEELDFGSGETASRDSALDVILREAREQDVLTLFPLLIHSPESERRRIYDRLAELIPPPAGVTREGVLRRNTSQINLWWENWGLGHPQK
jgi:FecR protein